MFDFLKSIKKIIEKDSDIDKADKMKICEKIDSESAEAAILGIANTVSVIKGEKSAYEALSDTVNNTSVQSAMADFVSEDTIDIINSTLSNPNSQFILALYESNIPQKIIDDVKMTGNAFEKYGKGELTTQECLIVLGDIGSDLGYFMTTHPELIPIPVIGETMGALLGAVLTSSYYKNLIDELKRNEYEHLERMRLIEECKQAAAQTRKYRQELEAYLEEYFTDYRSCFDSAINSIRFALQTGDADGVISGANQITSKLGGQVHYETLEEFKDFFDNTSVDII